MLMEGTITTQNRDWALPKIGDDKNAHAPFGRTKASATDDDCFADIGLAAVPRIVGHRKTPNDKSNNVNVNYS